MRVAYLINQYPKVSHSFIRREIHALERLGVTVSRFAVRGWDAEVKDAEDEAERGRTRYLLRDGAPGLLRATLHSALTRPVPFIRALALACRMGWRAERPLPVHLVYLAEACRLLFWLRAAGIHHLHAHFGTNAAEVAMLAHVLGGPPWSFTVHGPEEFDKASLIGLPEKIRRCTFVAAVSSFGRSQLYRYAALADWPKVKVVPCGLEPGFHADADTAVSEAPRLVCVGRLCEQKGQLLLIEAARQVVARGHDLELVLAGDGELRADVEAAVVRAGLADKVRITGWIDAAGVRAELLAARALVLPSFAEGLPVAIMEAMALRRPVISTYIAGIPELVRPGVDGWLVPAGDSTALADAMAACLAASAAELGRMGAAARERVLQRHDVDASVKVLLQCMGETPREGSET